MTHTPHLPEAVYDRAIGAVVASAAGDAMGAPYEFDPPNPTAPCQLEGGGAFGWAAGEWTDDTQMALTILTELATGSTSVDAIGERMAAWYRSRPRDVGNQTRAVLDGAVRHGLRLAAVAAEFQVRNPDAAGTGALMRTGPVALAHLGDRDAVARLAADIAALTHPHPDCVDACVLWSLAIEHAVMTAQPGQRFDWTGAVLAGLDHLDPTRRQLWRTRVTEADGARPEQWSTSNGSVVGAFQGALAAITSTPEPAGPAACTHLQRALEAAARSGGDTDTVAAIAGSLLGARWGATAVPLAWRITLHGHHTYDQPPLNAEQLSALARLTVRRGTPDKVGWPGVERLFDYYVDEYKPGLRVVTIDRVWFGTAAGLPIALERGATAVISLCRMGTHDVPAGVHHQRVGLLDTNAADNPNLPFVLADTAATIADLADEGHQVYVHCVAAENRAPTMAVAYLIARGATPDDALRTIHTALHAQPRRFLREALTHVPDVLAEL